MPKKFIALFASLILAAGICPALALASTSSLLESESASSAKAAYSIQAPTVTDLQVGKECSSYDVTGDGKADRLVVKGTKPSSPAGDGYYARLKVHVNGKKVLTSPKYWDTRTGFYPTVKLIQLRGGKRLLYIHYSTSNGYYAGGWVYRCTSKKATCLLKTERLVKAYSASHSSAWRCYESLKSVEGNTVSFSIGSTTTSPATYSYRYSDGKLKRQATS